ncbi:MAG: AraC family transcriptional regulator [Lentilitoribacter sp.]
MENFTIEFTSIATLSITVFGIIFCLLQTEFTSVSKSFAAFLLAIAVNNMPDALAPIIDTLPSVYMQPIELVIWQPSMLLLAPLFWIYVFTLTSREQRYPEKLYRHFILPLLTVFVGLVILFFGQEIWGTLFDNKPLPTSTWAIVLISSITLLQLASYPQIIIYLILIIRRLLRHRILLKDYYSSTEKHELRWIYFIGGSGLIFWFANATLLFLEFGKDQTKTQNIFINIGTLAGLAVVGATVLWGIRQRPPLLPGPALLQDCEPTHTSPLSEIHSPEPTNSKYEKSALNDEISSRIARKLRAAMENENLHRDPNLSLWTLSRHIGASPNYVSQTLNEVIGESFFDFVNSYRIAEAMTRLTSTNDNVLNITYDVGFNARSSFYNAFKRVVGETPTVYRKTMSHRNGVDDNFS